MRTLTGTIFILALLLKSIPSSSQRNDLIYGGYHGKVKSAVVTSYAPDQYDLLKKRNITLIRTFNFDEKGNIVEFISEYPRKKIKITSLFKYDDSGRRVEGRKISADTLQGRFTYQYDESGNRETEYRYSEKDSLDVKMVTRFDAAGRPVQLNLYKANDELSLKEIVTYGADGNIIETTGYNVQGELIDKFHYEYSDYDKAGNWRKQIAHRINVGTAQTNIRKLEYYDGSSAVSKDK